MILQQPGIPKPIMEPEAAVYYADHCCEFIQDNIIWPARNIMPGLEMTQDQIDIANEVNKSNRIAIESGHGTGKSTVYAWIAAWFICTRFNRLGQLIKIPLIAPTYHQLKDILWPELKRWIPMSRVAPMLHIMSEEIFPVGDKSLRQYKDQMFIRGRSPKNDSHVQGFHAEHLLWLIDEAFAIINEEVWVTIEGSLTRPDNKIIIGGQHSLLIGYVHEAFHRDKATWSRFRLDAEKSPVADKKFNLRIKTKYGINSDVYRVRVKGMEPRGNPEAFIQYGDAEAARHRDVRGEGAVRMGVDVAREGDDLFTVLTAWGYHVFPPAIQEKSDTDSGVNLVLHELHKARNVTKYKGPVEIRIDATGGYGAGIIDKLRKMEASEKIRVIPIDFGGPGNDEYTDLATRMWGNLRDIIGRLQLPDDDYLIEEIGTRRREYDAHGREKIEPKKKYKKDYGSSPDRADGLILCVFSQSWKKLVLPYFNMRHVLKLNINWEHAEKDQRHTLHYGALVQQEDMTLYAVSSLWDDLKGYLFVYDAWESPDPSPLRMAGRLIIQMRLRTFHVDKLIGSENMFSDEGKNTARLWLEYFRKAGFPLRLRPPVGYEPLASAIETNQMFAINRIYIDEKLEPVVNQIHNWSMEESRGKKTPDQPARKYNGYAVGICMTVAELRRRGKLKPVMKKPIFRDYNKKPVVTKAYDQARKKKVGAVWPTKA